MASPPTTPPTTGPTMLFSLLLEGWRLPVLLPVLPVDEPDVSGSLLPSPPMAEPDPDELVPVPIPPVMFATRDGVE